MQGQQQAPEKPRRRARMADAVQRRLERPVELGLWKTPEPVVVTPRR